MKNRELANHLSLDAMTTDKHLVDVLQHATQRELAMDDRRSIAVEGKKLTDTPREVLIGVMLDRIEWQHGHVDITSTAAQVDTEGTTVNLAAMYHRATLFEAVRTIEDKVAQWTQQQDEQSPEEKVKGLIEAMENQGHARLQLAGEMIMIESSPDSTFVGVGQSDFALGAFAITNKLSKMSGMDEALKNIKESATAIHALAVEHNNTMAAAPEPKSKHTDTLSM